MTPTSEAFAIWQQVIDFLQIEEQRVRDRISADSSVTLQKVADMGMLGQFIDLGWKLKFRQAGCNTPLNAPVQAHVDELAEKQQTY